MALGSSRFFWLNEERNFLLQQHRVADIEFDQAAQMGHAVEIHAFAAYANLDAINMGDAAPQGDADVISQSQLQPAVFLGADLGRLGQSDEGTLEREVFDLHLVFSQVGE